MINSLPENMYDEILSNNSLPHQVFPKSDVYKDLCSSIVYIFKVFHQKGYLRKNIDDQRLKTIFDGSRNLLLTSIDLICDGQPNCIFNLVVNIEFDKMLYKSKSISNSELFEFILVKNFVQYIKTADKDAIYCIISYLCESSIRNELLPCENWFDNLI